MTKWILKSLRIDQNFLKGCLLWIELYPPKRHVDVLTLSTSDSDPHWERQLLLMWLVKMRPLGWGLLQYDWCPYRVKLDIKTDMHRGKTMWKHSKEAFDKRNKDYSGTSTRNTCQRPKQEETRKESVLEPLGLRSQHLHFRFLASRAGRQHSSIVLGHLVFGALYASSRKLMQCLMCWNFQKKTEHSFCLLEMIIVMALAMKKWQ